MKKISLITSFFWKIIKPSFFNKVIAKDKIDLPEKGESVKTEIETAEVLINSPLTSSKILKFKNIPSTNLS